MYRNGAMLGTADFTATNGTTVVLATGATAGDLITTESFYVSSVLNAIPATNGAVTTPYILDGAVTAAKMAASGAWAPTGTVIQVVGGTYSTQTSTTSSTFTATGLSVSITPKFANSKILVVGMMNFQAPASQDSFYNLYRGATSLGQSSNGIGIVEAGNQVILCTNAISYLDSPATTSSTTYSISFRTTGSTMFCCVNGQVATLTALEIAG